MYNFWAHIQHTALLYKLQWASCYIPHSNVGSEEPNHRLETVVAILSGGPIGPGDRVNSTDVDFLQRSNC